jgi:hypothetical protein
MTKAQLLIKNKTRKDIFLDVCHYCNAYNPKPIGNISRTLRARAFNNEVCV